MTLTCFILPGCSYCKQARELIEELRAEKSAYAAIEIDFIDESVESALADRYDYYRVPSFFLAEKKLYEANPLWSRAKAKEKLDAMFASLV